MSCHIDDLIIDITVSIGISQFEQADDECKYILSGADKAMYHAKKKWRNNPVAFNKRLLKNQFPLPALEFYNSMI